MSRSSDRLMESRTPNKTFRSEFDAEFSSEKVEFTFALFPMSWDAAANWFVVLFIGVTSIVIINPSGLFVHLRSSLPLIYFAVFLFLGVIVLAHKYSDKLHPAYADLSPFKKWQWAMRVTSSIHAVIVATGGLYALTDDALVTDIVGSSSPTVNFFTCIFMGYTAMDSYCTLKFNDQGLSGGFPILLHHFMVLVISAYPVTALRFGMVTACYLVNEFSTPFMNQIFFFKDCQTPKDSKLVLANSVAFLLAFFLCRVVMNTYALVRMAEPGSLMYQESTFVTVTGIGFAAAFLMLNLFWFAKIVSNAVKIMRPAKKTSQYRRCEDDESLLESVGVQGE
eukprot:comp11489_c0_seq1/m.5938 comp11489_c0_seq1/g.5938  ORF comp11489_c0_seq1/g.5938 comp11489_c0_seq1/m.5938 type:complete len:337 (-) comp11489_c0_seq1:212-1222(-)